MSRIIRLFISYPKELGLEGLSAQEIVEIMKPERDDRRADVYNESPYASVFAEAINLAGRQNKGIPYRKSNRKRQKG